MEKGIGLGILVIVAVGLIFGLIVLTSIADQVNVATTTRTLTLFNTTGGAALTQYQAINAGYKVVNSTGYADIPASNVTIIPSITGVQQTLKVNVIDPKWTGQPLLINGTVEPVGYVTDAGSRSVVSLIVIMAALALLVFSLLPTLKEKFGF